MIALIYNLFFLLFALVSIPKFIRRLNQSGNWKQMLLERMGVIHSPLPEGFAQRPVLWLHAVSVGEVKAAGPLLELFLERYPNWCAAFSQTTATGREIARAYSSERVFTFYAPFDLTGCVRRTLKKIRPKVIALIETEIWPNWIDEASRQGIPIGIVNGRVSPRSYARYRWLVWWFQSLMRKLSFCFVQTGRDERCFAALGVPKANLAVLGNLKFDQSEPVRAPVQNFFGRGTSSNLIWVAGSTSDPEEKLILAAFQKLLFEFPGLKLVLVPRHPERLELVGELVKKYTSSWALFSEAGRGERDAEIVLVDGIGILGSVYGWADFVFVGGSLAKRGGQNPIEPARFRKPILHGPHVQNFHELYEALDQAGGAFLVSTQEALYEGSKKLLTNTQLRRETGEKAFQTVERFKGAAERTLKGLNRWLEEIPSPYAEVKR